ncbi:metallophosphoesterase 1-like isoform X4 [Mytilus galloprovincialis]|uniref:metallophosphoesterase 1-like isoform X4 n=1 Tax=Mytilus galloprovincialis TaxID=29158 RepID=UPI003F7C6D04
MARKNFACEWTPKSIILTIVIGTVLFNECFIYIIQSFRWPDIGLDDYRNYEEEQVILLVSDPQLQGYQMEPRFPIGAFSRWDIDRYLTRTFGLVYHHVKPDIILFLGDLIDEGSTASDEEFYYAYQRFNDVFSPAQYTKKIYIPGDNDIGGEGRDFRTHKKEERFVKHFENMTGVSTFGFIDYIKILQQVRPHLIFSGHWHKATVFLCNDCMKDDDSSWSVKQRNIEDMTGWMVTNLTEKPFSITEIMVPTCSYRMGVPHMGYGVAIIRKNGELSYTVLWTPARYKMLYGYLVAICVCLLVCLASRLFRKR